MGLGKSLPIRSTRQPTAWHSARAAPQTIMCCAGQAPCRRLRVTSNVMPHTTSPRPTSPPMNIQHVATRLFILCWIAAASGWASSANAQSTQKVPRPLQAVADQFARSYILGTGESHFLNSVETIDPDNAVAVVGSVGEYGRNPNAYTVYLKRINGKWKVVRYEFILMLTGKKESRD